jgi:hypothetical protein
VTGKNLRLLGIEESPARQPSIIEMIRDLETEIDRGTDVYTPAELARLEAKLTEYRELLQLLQQGG